jgi:hypothetical protein
MFLQHMKSSHRPGRIQEKKNLKQKYLVKLLKIDFRELNL